MNASSFMCSSSGMENLKYITFWSGLASAQKSEYGIGMGAGAVGFQSSPRAELPGSKDDKGRATSGRAGSQHLTEMVHPQRLFVQMLPEVGGEKMERSQEGFSNSCGNKKGSTAPQSTTKSWG